MSGKKLAKYKKIDVDLGNESVSLYVGTRIRAALEEVTVNMDLYQGVRLSQVMKAVYDQGLKDGRKEVIEQIDSIKKTTNYLPPGRPRKRK